MGDVNTAGGAIKTGDSSVLVNKRPVAVIGLAVTPHLPCPKGASHCAAKTSVKIARSVRANNKPVIVSGDNDTCGHMRSRGSINVNVGINKSQSEPTPR
jgi:uncharacterized Zn-binding protein involved in type VI secretion